ncbi:serine/threonine-protein kinase [Janibacter cremeus]|uniref:serine/threonine-protein kinase n=1 Tax=Janibacter cremeus TaxID=1285192 RepID=UPI0023F6C1A1|nr:serine/threonine-protein kinase [Janibacter cremeus]WEV79684.1 serine/threonine-protein kinase [Janibacter cremeus]
MGEVFAGRYELLDLIGQGGMGSVWLVHDRRTDSVVAAKVLRQSDAASLLRFVRETAFRVQHSHVVTPLGWAGEDDRVLFTMPVVDGGSVATLVGDHGPLPAPFVAEVLRQLLDGLSAVHASRIVHRDVKPANVLLAATGSDRPHVYLTDFGIAVELDGPRLTETNVAIGTPGYMAPEQRRGELTTASDLYAVGALARFMLTALPPEGDPLTLDRPRDVSESLWSLTADLLADDPADRPDAAATMARLQEPGLAWTSGAAGDVEVLQQVFDTSAGDTEPLEPPTVVVSGPESAPGPGSGSPPRRRRAGLLSTGAVTVAVVLVAVVLAWTSLTDRDPGGGDTATSPPASSSPSTDGPSPSSSSSSPAEQPEPTPTSTTGSVEVGTVVGRVGQPCEFSDVGLRETTSDGVEVVCQQADDGGYSWERADS